MHELSWFGWIGVKIALEARLRNVSVERLKVDGHKGVPLRFEGRCLQQPLYVLIQKGGEVETIRT